MRIAFDARALTQQPTGTGAYLKNLLDEFARAEDDHQYYLLSCRKCYYTPPINETRFQKIISRGLPGNLWLQLLVPKILKKSEIDIFHSPFGVIPFRSPCATVITVHDLAYHLYPQYTDFKNRVLLPRLVPKSINLTDTIIADSQAIKTELIQLYKLRESRIKVIHLAPDVQFHPMPKETARQHLADKYQIQSPFILFVGTLEPRKNILRLIKAYHELSLELRNKFQLVIVGKKGWLYQNIFRLVKTLHLQDRIIFTGYVPATELPRFYNAATFFVFPSLYEGFGLPLVDALACGTPVITSDTSSMAEIVSYAGILVDPTDTSTLTQAMTKLLTDKELYHYLSEKALMRSHTFSWQDTAQKTNEIYRTALRKFTVQKEQK